MEINYSRQREERRNPQPDQPMRTLGTCRHTFASLSKGLWSSWCEAVKLVCNLKCKLFILLQKTIFMRIWRFISNAVRQRSAAPNSHKNEPFRYEQGQHSGRMDEMNQVIAMIAWLNFPITWHSIEFNRLRGWQRLSLCVASSDCSQLDFENSFNVNNNTGSSGSNY